MRFGEIRSQRNRPSKARFSLRELPQVTQCISHVIEANCRTRIQLKRIAVTIERLTRVPALVKCIGEVDMHTRMARLELDCASKACHRFFEPACSLQCQAQVVMCIRIVGKIFRRHFGSMQCILSLLQQRKTERLPCESKARSTFQQLLRQSFHVRVTHRGRENRKQSCGGFCMCGLCLQNLTIQAFRVIDPALTVTQERLLKDCFVSGDVRVRVGEHWRCILCKTGQ